MAVLNAKEKEIGGLAIRRALPAIQQRAIGPWLLFDHIGPIEFPPGQGINLPPHPHINMATVTYLFEGEIFHRDSLGHAVAIEPGAINLMVAGKGISHSERTRPELRKTGYRLHALQLWLALPESHEEIDPAFFHHPAETFPVLDMDGAHIRVLMGAAYNLASPVKTYSPTLYVDIDMSEGASLLVPEAQERAVYVVDGSVSVNGHTLRRHSMLVLPTGEQSIRAQSDACVVIIGGDPLGKRHMWWNFVSSRKDRIEQAKHDWSEGKFGTVHGDEEEFIPLPE